MVPDGPKRAQDEARMALYRIRSWKLRPRTPTKKILQKQKSNMFSRLFDIFKYWLSSLQLRISCPTLGHLGLILGPLGAILGSSWAFWGPSWALLGPSRGHLGVILGHPGRILGHLRPILGPSWAIWGPPRAIFGASRPLPAILLHLRFNLTASWGYVGPFWGCLGPSFPHSGASQ